MKRVKQFHYVFLLQAAGTALRSDSLKALRFSVFSEEDKSDAGERSSYAKIKYPSCRAGAHKKTRTKRDARLYGKKHDYLRK